MRSFDDTSSGSDSGSEEDETVEDEPKETVTEKFGDGETGLANMFGF